MKFFAEAFHHFGCKFWIHGIDLARFSRRKMNNQKRNDSSLKNHYNRIKTKKKEIIKKTNTTYFGTIGAIDNSNSVLSVYLVDPVFENISINPEKYQILAKLSYYLKLFRQTGVYAKICNELEKRIYDIVNSEDYKKFDKNPLSEARKKKHYFDNVMKADINGNEARGRVFFVKRQNMIVPYIIALPRDIVKLVINKDFKSILDYKYNSAEINDKVSVKLEISLSDIQKYDVPSFESFVFSEKSKKYEYMSRCSLRHTISGRIFGMIDNKE